MSVCDWSSGGVSIVVISFNPCFNGCRSAIVLTVAVLPEPEGFNPCFNGCRSAIFLVLRFLQSCELCFNPCFNGCRSAILCCGIVIRP